jgi:hypothetical protein
MPSRESNFVLGVFGDSGTLKEALNQVRIHVPIRSKTFVFAGEEQMKIVMDFVGYFGKAMGDRRGGSRNRATCFGPQHRCRHLTHPLD